MPSINYLKKKLLFAIIENTKIEGECIIYTGVITSDGYGQLSHDYKRYRIHRLIGCIVRNLEYNTDYEFHHTCGNKLCVNSNHVIPLTKREHSQITGKRKICINGHDTSVVGRSKNNVCLACRKMYNNINNKKNK